MENKIIDLRYSAIQYDVPEFIYKDLCKFCKESNLYHPQPVELIKKISRIHTLSMGNIFISAGSDEAILIMGREYGKNIVIFPPTYKEYTNKVFPNGKVRKITSLKGDQYEIKPKTYKNCSLIFIANPNNPFGYTDPSVLIQLIKLNPKSIVVVDETYAEFTKISIINQVKNFNNLVVLRSFSKDFGMAGIRLGYVIAKAKIIHALISQAQVTNTSYLSVGAGISALNNKRYFHSLRTDVINERESLFQFLKLNNFRVINSKINTIVLKFKSINECKKLSIFLKHRNILTSIGNGKSIVGLDDTYLRLVVGNSFQMKIVKNIIKRYINENK